MIGRLHHVILNSLEALEEPSHPGPPWAPDVRNSSSAHIQKTVVFRESLNPARRLRQGPRD
jgi:hypothetical protein